MVEIGSVEYNFAVYNKPYIEILDKKGNLIRKIFPEPSVAEKIFNEIIKIWEKEKWNLDNIKNEQLMK